MTRPAAAMRAGGHGGTYASWRKRGYIQRGIEARATRESYPRRQGDARTGRTTHTTTRARRAGAARATDRVTRPASGGIHPEPPDEDVDHGRGAARHLLAATARGSDWIGREHDLPWPRPSPGREGVVGEGRQGRGSFVSRVGKRASRRSDPAPSRPFPPARGFKNPGRELAVMHAPPASPFQADRPRRPRPSPGPEGPWWRQPLSPR